MNIDGAVGVEFELAAIAEPDLAPLPLGGTQFGHQRQRRGALMHAPAGGADGQEHGQGLYHCATARPDASQGRQGDIGRQAAKLALQLFYPGPGLGMRLTFAQPVLPGLQLDVTGLRRVELDIPGGSGFEGTVIQSLSHSVVRQQQAMGHGTDQVLLHRGDRNPQALSGGDIAQAFQLHREEDAAGALTQAVEQGIDSHQGFEDQQALFR
ncbi:hypothetical protein D3C75_898970 [compost metagenome]